MGGGAPRSWVRRATPRNRRRPLPPTPSPPDGGEGASSGAAYSPGDVSKSQPTGEGDGGLMIPHISCLDSDRRKPVTSRSLEDRIEQSRSPLSGAPQRRRDGEGRGRGAPGTSDNTHEPIQPIGSCLRNRRTCSCALIAFAPPLPLPVASRTRLRRGVAACRSPVVWNHEPPALPIARCACSGEGASNRSISRVVQPVRCSRRSGRARVARPRADPGRTSRPPGS